MITEEVRGKRSVLSCIFSTIASSVEASLSKVIQGSVEVIVYSIAYS